MIGSELEKLLYTRPVPDTPEQQLAALLRWARGSKQVVARELGVSQRTVQRWTARKASARAKPSVRHAAVIETRVRERWQPLVRARRRAAVERQGLVVHTRARFGFEAGPGSSDDARQRLLTVPVPGEVARELFRAWEAGAPDSQHKVILGRALGHVYFRAAGRRADALQVKFGEVDFIEFGLA
ncbi:telomere-protecting terminal protein Tpg [Streptomyces sp. NPDC059989]|uniref:telomere-protecting terminal protein Tpg n=1 Tax=Streptomyces sp. NPDC059989 TaxID=3347026 RepID=UPI00368739D6